MKPIENWPIAQLRTYPFYLNNTHIHKNTPKLKLYIFFNNIQPVNKNCKNYICMKLAWLKIIQIKTKEIDN